jgi:hypothetical protein
MIVNGVDLNLPCYACRREGLNVTFKSRLALDAHLSVDGPHGPIRP